MTHRTCISSQSMKFPPAILELNPGATSRLVELYSSVPDLVLKVVKPRKTKYGDCMVNSEGTIITINDGMTPRQTFITMVHELAHHFQFTNYIHKVSPHGPEWKMEYKKLMNNFIGVGLLDADFEETIKNHMINPAASSCRDVSLQKSMNPGTKYVSDLVGGDRFLYKFLVYEIMEKLKKNYKCKSEINGKLFVFQPFIPITIVSRKK